MAWRWNGSGKTRTEPVAPPAVEPAPPAPPPVDEEARAKLERLEKQVALIEAHFTDGFWKALDVAYEASLPHRRLSCLVCGHTGLPGDFKIHEDRCLFGGGKLQRYECPECDCIFGPQKYLDLDEAFVSRDYAVLYSRYSEADSTENEVRTFHTLDPRPGGAYLDWGCGGAWSRTVSSLREGGWDVLGYEPSAETAGEFVVNQREMIKSPLDGIFSNNVIEHFRDPIAQFKEFRELLKPGGKMAHSSPCYEYCYAYTRFHTVFLLGRSPHVLAERTGFKVVDSVKDGQYINYVFARVD